MTTLATATEVEQPETPDSRLATYPSDVSLDATALLRMLVPPIR